MSETTTNTRKTISSKTFCEKLVDAYNKGVTSRQFAIDLYELGTDASDDAVQAAMQKVNGKRATINGMVRKAKPEFSLPKLKQEGRTSSADALLGIFDGLDTDEQPEAGQDEQAAESQPATETATA